MTVETELLVWREIYGEYELVGTLFGDSDSLEFEYEESYLRSPSSKALSASLPLEAVSFGERATKAFFDGLLPEGSLRKSLSLALRTSMEDVSTLLSRLSDESCGALVFTSIDGSPTDERWYEDLDSADLSSFATQPHKAALNLCMSSRLSLAGAQSKIGLKLDRSEDGLRWLIPHGTASTSHIIKASDGTFPNLTLNEAVCMRAAKLLHFEVPDVFLLNVDANEPLLAIERFDRVTDTGLEFPLRLHQEDFCQALGLASFQKYEPSGAHYPSLCSSLLAERSANSFGDNVFLFESICLSALIGNCDNHLKNYSLLLDESWTNWEMAPLYDITCTTVYDWLDREMGVALCPSRKVDDVRPEDMLAVADSMHIPRSIVRVDLCELCDQLLGAIRLAGTQLASEGFPKAEIMADAIIADRSEFVTDASRQLRSIIH